jgi:hypothetical protein
MSKAEHLRMTADLMEEQERQAEEMKRLGKRLDQIETASDHFTLIGYYRYTRRESLPLAEASRLGKQATAYCKAHRVSMGSVPDARFGTVHTYPKWVLDGMLDAESSGETIQ